MAVPDYQTLMRPALVATDANEPQGQPQIRDTVAAAMNLTDEDRQVLLPSGRQEMFANRVSWALNYLHHAKLVERPTRGHYFIT